MRHIYQIFTFMIVTQSATMHYITPLNMMFKCRKSLNLILPNAVNETR